MARAALDALIRIISVISSRHGGLRGEKELFVTLATNRVHNSYGSILIGPTIEPFIEEAAEQKTFAFCRNRTARS